MTTTSQQPLDLDAIRQRCEAASPDPWELVTTSTLHMNGTGGYNIRAASMPGFRLTITAFPADAQFIAHARTDVPALLAEVERLRDELAMWRDDVSAQWLAESIRLQIEVDRLTRKLWIADIAAGSQPEAGAR